MMDKGMGFDSNKAKYSADEKAADARAKAEGTRNRRAFVNALLNLITAADTDPEIIREAQACRLWFPEGQQAVDKIAASYEEKPEVLKTVLLSTILAPVERLV